MTIPEPSLLPPELPAAPLRCCLCLRPAAELLELPYGLLCQPCLHSLSHRPLDDAAAILCAPIVTQDEKEVLPCRFQNP